MRQMSFIKSIFSGVKLYFLMSLAIGLGFFIDIQRNDLKGNITGSTDYIYSSIDILTIVFPLFCFYVGSTQSNLIKRKTDSGFAASISAAIGFLMLTYMNLFVILASLWIANSNHIDFNSGMDEINTHIWKIIPAIFAGLISAIINNQILKNTMKKIKMVIFHQHRGYTL